LLVGFTRLACQVDLRIGGLCRIDMTTPERIVYRGMSDDRHACGCGIPPYSRVIVSFTELGAQGHQRSRFRPRLVASAGCA
jgi:hypothetical protein